MAINHKGTKVPIINNTIFTTDTEPAAANQNDVWYDTSFTPRAIKIYNGITWVSMEHRGTAGSLFYADENGDPSENNTRLFWDKDKNRLGVGTNSPTHVLEVEGATATEALVNSDGTTGRPSYRFKDDDDTGMYSPAADELAFSVGGYEALLIDEPTVGVTKVIVNQTLELEGPVLDEANSPGTVGQVLSATAAGTSWIDNTPIQTTTTITNTISGSKIADYKNEVNDVVPINETVTSLTQNVSSSTGEITYTDERGGVTGKARVVSADFNNTLAVGSDGGSYLGSTVFTDYFIISPPGGTGGNRSQMITINDPKFKPSQITFVANANVEEELVNGSGSILGSDLDNSFGTTNGFARNIDGTIFKQQFSYIGASGGVSLTNATSRYAAPGYCLGIRYSSQGGNDLGRITAKVVSFNDLGFTLEVTYSQGENILLVDRNQVFSESLLVLYTAYR
ncbi:hypothetical protein [Flavobacterium sp. 14A]|uniref:hypothetical protein n=1 Tax=Flavobacterium sp. 14A TaxID=2735896 RepID=UPI00156D7794|nr:hypothetical protein [Flavobacterium sp. 14A]NRT12883.1 hypothetical protein [Flavobacterium sp. 14A]